MGRIVKTIKIRANPESEGEDVMALFDTGRIGVIFDGIDSPKVKNARQSRVLRQKLGERPMKLKMLV